MEKERKEERVTHELVFDRPVYIGTDISLHLFEIKQDSIRIGIDAPRTTRVDRQEHKIKRKKNREICSKPGYLGRAIVRKKKRPSRTVRLRALIDLPEYGVIKGAHLLFFYRHNYYRVKNSNGEVVERYYWSEDDLDAEIKGGLWAVVTA